MRLSRFLILLLLSIQINVIFHKSVGDSFVTIPAWVAFGAITTAVKLKLILVKIMFALKTMGIGSIRIKRSGNHNEDELLLAWRDLEATLGRNLQFILDSCISGATSQEGLVRNIRAAEVPSNHTEWSPNRRSQPDKYAIFVSSTIGSMTRSVSGCYFLQDALYGPITTQTET